MHDGKRSRTPGSFDQQVLPGNSEAREGALAKNSWYRHSSQFPPVVYSYLRGP